MNLLRKIVNSKADYLDPLASLSKMTESEIGRYISTCGWAIVFPPGNISGKNEYILDFQNH